MIVRCADPHMLLYVTHYTRFSRPLLSAAATIQVLPKWTFRSKAVAAIVAEHHPYRMPTCMPKLVGGLPTASAGFRSDVLNILLNSVWDIEARCRDHRRAVRYRCRDNNKNFPFPQRPSLASANDSELDGNPF